jgi:hypothetical protein
MLCILRPSADNAMRHFMVLSDVLPATKLQH